MNTQFAHAAMLRTTRLTALAVLALAIARPAGAQTYNVTNLGKDFTPRAVNDAGQVVGDTPAGVVLWNNGTQTVLPSSSGHRAWGMNASGQVVGVGAFLWTPTVLNGNTGTYTDLNATLPEGSGWVIVSAKDINDAGKIVGEGDFTDSNGTTHYGVDFLWEVDEQLLQAGVARYGKLTPVPMGTSNNWNPSVLNNLASPEVAGTAPSEADYLYDDAFIWQAETGRFPLGALGAGFTQAWDINDLGQVVGISEDKAFLWSPEGTAGVVSNPQMQDLQPATGIQQSKAFSINNSGLVVGVGIYASSGAYFGFAWDNTSGWRDVNKVSNKPANWQLQFARGCNNRNVNGAPSAQIVASGYIAVTTTTIVRKKKTTTTTNQPHGFLLTPQ